MGSINTGDQIIDFAYKEEATSSNFNRIFRDILRPGVYTGGALVQQSPNTVAITPLKMVLRSSDVDADKGVTVRTRQNINVTLPNTPNGDYTIYAIFTYALNPANFADFEYRLTASSAVANEIVIGRVINNVSGTISEISYSNRIRGYFDPAANDNLTTSSTPTQAYHVGNREYNDDRYQLVDSEYIRVRNLTGGTLPAYSLLRAVDDYAAGGISAGGPITDISVQNPIGMVLTSFLTATSQLLLRRGRVVVTGLDATGSVKGNPVYVDSSGLLTLAVTAKQVGYVLNTTNPAVILLDIGGSGGSGGGGTGTSITIPVNQNAHGFIVGNVIYPSISGWQLAQANDAATVGSGVVSTVSDINNFEVTLYGTVELTTGEWDAVTGGSGGLVSGQQYYTSDLIAGEYTTNILAIENPIFYGLSTTEAFISPYFTAAESGAGNTIVEDYFTGDGVTVSFPLSATPPSNSYCFVWVGGSRQRGGFNISSNNLIFDTAPLLGTEIIVSSFIATIFSNEISQYNQRNTIVINDESSVIFNSTTLFQTINSGMYEIWDQSDPNTFVLLAFKQDATPVVTLRDYSPDVDSSDVDGFLCIYVSGSDVILKNRLGSSKTFVIHRRI